MACRPRCRTARRGSRSATGVAGTGLAAPTTYRWCITAFGAASRESNAEVDEQHPRLLRRDHRVRHRRGGQAPQPVAVAVRTVRLDQPRARVGGDDRAGSRRRRRRACRWWPGRRQRWSAPGRRRRGTCRRNRGTGTSDAEWAHGDRGERVRHRRRCRPGGRRRGTRGDPRRRRCRVRCRFGRVRTPSTWRTCGKGKCGGEAGNCRSRCAARLEGMIGSDVDHYRAHAIPAEVVSRRAASRPRTARSARAGRTRPAPVR